MHLPPLGLDPITVRTILFWITLGLGILVLALATLGATIQSRSDRKNRLRIACFQAWEEALPRYLFEQRTASEAFGEIPKAQRDFFMAFLHRYRNTLAGADNDRLIAIYPALGLGEDLEARLGSPNPVLRAQAALEVQAYRCEAHLSQVAELLQDPQPFVSFAAARTLGAFGHLEHAPSVLVWIRHQEDYQQDRLLEVLEGFGPALLRWMEANLPPAEEEPEPWRLMALLAATLRDEDTLPTLLRLLTIPEVELQGAALRAIGTLGDLQAWGAVAPFLGHASSILRLHAARVAGNLGSMPAVPELTQLLSDPVYEVRREAATALANLGHLGWESLLWVAADEGADPFARDMARERLEWGLA